MPKKGRPSNGDLKFVNEYMMNGRNATAAFRTVFPNGCEGLPDSRVRVKACWYTKRTHVRALILAGEAKAIAKTEKVLEKYAQSKERIAEELARIAFTNQTDVMEWGPDGAKVKPSSELTEEAKAAVSEVTETITKDGKALVKVKNYDKVSALIALGKQAGMFREEENKTPHMAVQFIIQRD